MAAATLVNAFGNGLFAVASMLFFTRMLGLGDAAVAVGLTIAEIVGLTCSVPIGVLSDRIGAKAILQALWLCQGAATLLFLTAHSLLLFVPVGGLYAIAQKGARGVTNALIAGAANQSERVAIRAYLRSINNLGMAVGALAGGIAVAANTSRAYTVLFAVDAVTFVVAIALVAWYRPMSVVARARGAQARRALRDLRYGALTTANGLLCLQYSVIMLVLPLWISERTEAPRWIISTLLALNTIMVVLLQVPASRSITSSFVAARYLRRGGLLFLVSVTALGAAQYGAAPMAIALLVFGTILHTIAEMWHAAGSFEASLTLADPTRHGEYQSVFALGQGVAESLAPAVLVTLCIGLGIGGWLIVAAILLASAYAMSALLTGQSAHHERSGVSRDASAAHS